METHAVRPELGQAMHGLDRVEVGAHHVAKWITTRISHRPQSKREEVVGTGCVLIRHVGSFRPVGGYVVQFLYRPHPEPCAWQR